MRTIQDRSLFVLWESTALFEQFITNERQLPRTCHTVVPKSFLQVFLHYSQWTFQNWVKVLKRIWVISCKTHPWLDTTPMWYPFSMTLRGPKSSNLAKPWGWEVTGSTSINFQKGTKNRYKNTRIHNWQWNSMVFFFRPTRQPCLFLGGPRFLFTEPWRTKRLLGSNRIFTQFPGDLQETHPRRRCLPCF